MSGLIHIYCGDGKGKTTAAAGLAVRAAGAGKRVLFAQFLKDGTSSEIPVLKGIDGVRVRLCHTVTGWVRDMTASQREQAARDYGCFLAELFQAAEAYDLLVLDEAVGACNHGLIREEALTAFLREKPAALEVVLTGRDPSPALMALGDYITEMRKMKHPFDRGIRARKGIEF